jgi:hypothetical protein
MTRIKAFNIFAAFLGWAAIVQNQAFGVQPKPIDVGATIINPLFSGTTGSCPQNWICGGSPAPGFTSYSPTTAQYPSGARFATSGSSPTTLGGSGVIRQLTPLTWAGGSSYTLNLWIGLPATEPDGTTPVSGWPGAQNGAVRVYLTMGQGFGQVAAFDIPSPPTPGSFVSNPITFTLPSNSGAIGQAIGVMIFVSGPSSSSANFAITPAEIVATNPPSSPAIPPARLPAPPVPVVGCYVNTRNGWKGTPCATKEFIDANFPRPDMQLTVTSPSTTPLVFGQIDVTIPQVASITDVSGGSSNANRWSFQSTTDIFTVPGGHANSGNQAAVQFVIQSNGTTSAICIWNVDVTSQSYPNQCVVPDPQQRPGGLQAFDYGNIAGYANSNGTLSMVAELSWVPSGQPNQYAVVASDANGLAGNWTAMSGGLLGLGDGSQAQLTNAEVVTQILASTCAGDTQPGSPLCAPPTLQPNASVFIGGTGTVETNNLTAIGTPSLSYLNTDLAVTNITGTTSGSCLGPSHVYVKDSAEDFGAIPSTLGNQVFWESPDIFLVPHGTPVNLNSVSTETTITPGGAFDVWVRLHNDLGCSDVTGAKTLVYLADPSALSVQWSSITGMQYVGNNLSTTGVTVPAGGQALIGPLPFTAPSTGIGNGHKCLLAAIQANGEPAPTNSTDAPRSNQVAQRNLEFASPCVYPLTNGTTSDGNVQVTLTVTPNSNTTPSLTGSPDMEVTFDDADSSWFNVWNSQSGNGATFSVTHNSVTNSTTVRLGAFSVTLNAVPLAAGQSRNAMGRINPGSGTLTLQIAATLTDLGGNVLVSNGGSCTATATSIG